MLLPTADLVFVLPMLTTRLCIVVITKENLATIPWGGETSCGSTDMSRAYLQGAGDADPGGYESAREAPMCTFVLWQLVSCPEIVLVRIHYCMTTREAQRPPSIRFPSPKVRVLTRLYTTLTKAVCVTQERSVRQKLSWGSNPSPSAVDCPDSCG